MTISGKPLPQTFGRLPHIIVEEISKTPERFKDLEEGYKNNRELATHLIERGINITPWLPEDLSKDPELVRKIFQKFPQMGKNKSFLQMAIKIDRTFAAFANPSILKSSTFLREILTEDPQAANHLPDSIKNDINFSLILAQAKASGNSISPPVVRKTSLRKSISLTKSPINPVNQATPEQI